MMKIEDHKISSARYIASPNHNDRPDPADISLIVLHGISLPPGQFEGEAITQLFLNQLDGNEHPYFQTLLGLEVSSHLLIRRCGELIQYVPFDKRAWHAGRSSFQGRAACNDFAIGIELEGSDEVPYSDAQYVALLPVLRLLYETYPSTAESGIVGHCDIAPGRKTDPGPFFEWERLEKSGFIRADR